MDNLSEFIASLEAGTFLLDAAPTARVERLAYESFSGSVDAAIALPGELLPGWAIERMASWPGRCCRVSLWGTHDLGGERWHSCEDGRIDAEGPTLARALLLATLRAYRDTEGRYAP